MVWGFGGVGWVGGWVGVVGGVGGVGVVGGWGKEEESVPLTVDAAVVDLLAAAALPQRPFSRRGTVAYMTDHHPVIFWAAAGFGADTHHQLHP